MRNEGFNSKAHSTVIQLVNCGNTMFNLTIFTLLVGARG
jgi:hypothetical protein